jgi:hypothetical protein
MRSLRLGGVGLASATLGVSVPTIVAIVRDPSLS